MTRKQDTKDESDAEARYQKSRKVEVEAREEEVPVENRDAERYLYLRNSVRNSAGVIDEKLYVRCDGRTDGKWALDGEELDTVIDLLMKARAERAVAEQEAEPKA